MKNLVIGYGNTLRGDDGVGPWVAEQLSQEAGADLRAIAVFQLTPDLAAEIAWADRVWFVDAWVGGCVPRIRPVGKATPLPAMTHGWQPEDLMEWAKILYQAEPIAYHLLLPARDFEYGDTLSPAAMDGGEWAVQQIQTAIQRELERWAQCLEEVDHA